MSVEVPLPEAYVALPYVAPPVSSLSTGRPPRSSMTAGSSKCTAIGMIAPGSVIVCGPYRSSYGDETYSRLGEAVSITMLLRSPSVLPDMLAGSARLAGVPR